MIRLIVDSTCDLNSLITDNYDVAVIPLNVILDEVTYLDGVDIDLNTVYEYMEAGKVPKTSQVSFDSVCQAYDQCVSNNDDFIYLSFSSKLSGTYNFAKQIMTEYQKKYPKIKMAIIDSQGGAGGAGLIVLQALKMAEKGLPFETVVEQIYFMIDHLSYYFTISDLEWLSKGGRISKPVGYVANMLNIKPYLTIKDGELVVTKMIRGRKKVLNTIVNDVASNAINFKDQLIGISHAHDLNTALEIEEKIKETITECKTTIFEIGAVLGSHLGIGGVGVFCLDEKPEHYQFI